VWNDSSPGFYYAFNSSGSGLDKQLRDPTLASMERSLVLWGHCFHCRPLALADSWRRTFFSHFKNETSDISLGHSADCSFVNRISWVTGTFVKSLHLRKGYLASGN